MGQKPLKKPYFGLKTVIFKGFQGKTIDFSRKPFENVQPFQKSVRKYAKVFENNSDENAHATDSWANLCMLQFVHATNCPCYSCWHLVLCMLQFNFD